MGLQPVEGLKEDKLKIPEKLWRPNWWGEILRQVPQFTEPLIAAWLQEQQQIDEYIAAHNITVPDFSKIQTVAELFDTGWRFHVTYWGILVPPGYLVRQNTVLIYCQISGESLMGWKNKGYVVINPTPITDSVTGQQSHEKVYVCERELPWIKEKWMIKKPEPTKPTAPTPASSAGRIFNSAKFFQDYSANSKNGATAH